MVSINFVFYMFMSSVQSAFRGDHIVCGGLHYLALIINARDVHANLTKFLIL